MGDFVYHFNTKKKKMNVRILKRIMPENNTGLPSLRNQDWKIVKDETEKTNEY